ncbi:unnamed protein product [Owenia fusiformis]|uniref:BTB domain-containing protein n=1 Tax=Owenia fusiformis TaxID=6347 RepID=A0A8S4Q594_OWEFU|nr:unnamed protein product [Owenia fusiformis]
MEGKTEYVKNSINFGEPWDEGDMVLISESDEKVYASNAVLKMMSPVFKAMFNSDMKEKNMTEVKLPGKSTTDLVVFMEAIHPNTWATVSVWNIDVLLQLSREYLVDKLIKRCENYMAEAEPCLANFIRAAEYGFQEVKKKNMQFVLAQPLTVLQQHYWFSKLKDDDLVNILQTKVLMQEYAFCTTTNLLNNYFDEDYTCNARLRCTKEQRKGNLKLCPHKTATLRKQTQDAYDKFCSYKKTTDFVIHPPGP